jgi:hypothetical protein
MKTRKPGRHRAVPKMNHRQEEPSKQPPARTHQIWNVLLAKILNPTGFGTATSKSSATE